MADVTKDVDAIFLNMNAIFPALEMIVYGTLGLSGAWAVRRHPSESATKAINDLHALFS